ncbi:FCD domain-containing protein [Streptomyces sp. NPDC088194]|uniref:FCD domain-containing protein n=1 Tax=Streptomyces sp. NPDC088194 TaxID=3154931 RepID=UPI00344BCB19
MPSRASLCDADRPAARTPFRRAGRARDPQAADGYRRRPGLPVRRPAALADGGRSRAALRRAGSSARPEGARRPQRRAARLSAASRRAGRPGLIAYLEADRRFHLGLPGLAGNAHLVQVVGDLRKRSRLYGLTAPDARGRLVESAEEHLELLDLMIAGDVEGAQACMRRHLGNVRSLWADTPEGAPSAGPDRGAS